MGVPAPHLPPQVRDGRHAAVGLSAARATAREGRRPDWERIMDARKVGNVGVGNYVYRPSGSVMSDAEFGVLAGRMVR